MPWEKLNLEELAEKLGIDYSEVRAKHDLVRKIKAARKKHSLTQEDLAKMLGKSQSWIAKVESGLGTKNISFETLLKILSMLGYDYKIVTKKVSNPEKVAA
ncbi:MAG: helix-turn-helix domain-containing protein [Deltaproteobacteria bacterium]|nr:helix-turn-helix domain-containing protein [Deltaproteobacteria bacterium]